MIKHPHRGVFFLTRRCLAAPPPLPDTFLREVAPQVKSAELIAEDKARQDCIGNISSCFQKACKDTIDPNDPDGSYDMCLSRPETMLNLCKVPLNACGIDASSVDKAQDSQIWDFDHSWCQGHSRNWFGGFY